MEEKRHTSSHYEKELQEIKNGLIFLGALTEKAILMAMKSLSERNSDKNDKNSLSYSISVLKCSESSK